MSGHSKWHNIQKTKGAADAKRAQAFTKIAREMIVAVKEGGGSADPANNSRLATVIAKAKAANMPNDNIKRTLEKAAGSAGGDNFESVTYEGYGPEGVAVIVDAMTDNRNRTASEVRHLFDKYGGNMGAAGCVSWSFEKKGVIVIDNEDEDYDEDTVMMDALEAGAEDMSAEEETFEVYTDPDSFPAVLEALEGKKYKFVSAQVEMVLRITSSSPTRRTSRSSRRCWSSWTTTTTSRTSGTTGTSEKFNTAPPPNNRRGFDICRKLEIIFFPGGLSYSHIGLFINDHFFSIDDRRYDFYDLFFFHLLRENLIFDTVLFKFSHIQIIIAGRLVGVGIKRAVGHGTIPKGNCCSANVRGFHFVFRQNVYAIIHKANF